MKEIHNINGWLLAESVTIGESKDSGYGDIKVKGTSFKAFILPFNKVSRNGVLYNKESVEKNKDKFVGCNILYNHVIEGIDSDVLGIITETWTDDKGLYIGGVLDDKSEKARQVKDGFLNKLSVQINAGKVIEQESEDKVYREAFMEDALEVSFVTVPGFKEARRIESVIAESFNPNNKQIQKESMEEEFIEEFKKLDNKKQKQIYNNMVNNLAKII